MKNASLSGYCLRALCVAEVSSEFIEQRTRNCIDNELCDTCTLCAPGFETSHVCTETKDTVCTQCIPGQSFNPVAGRNVYCKPCKDCPINSRLKRSCNLTHNTECECERDFYIDLASGTCKPCTVCTHGYGAARPCSPFHNTLCRTCPHGTYNNMHSTTSGCIPCTQCKESQHILHRCTHIQDTICAESDIPFNGRRRDMDTIDEEAEESDSIIAIYCALLASVVFGLLVYVTIKQCRAKPPIKTNGTVPSSASVPLCHPRPTLVDMELPPSRLDRRAKPNDVRPIMVVNEKGKKLRTALAETRMRDVSLAKRREMEILLDMRSNDDWMLLAEYLGYSSPRINVLGQRALEKQVPPARCLLSDWAKQEESYIGYLAEALEDIGREDVATVLWRSDDSSRPLDIL
ncbi:tumor necrosis factor receptor superfamily member 16-like isoform X2 [Artemia franciscana]|uniref:tumor necrosis factor receptor superfamily member 16-like isoform X2 n=1 Tax=Artemia franciscana TaxID=6661 RepID=UPI0032DA1C11